MKYKVWNKQDVLVTPIGEVLTAEQVINRYPASGLEGFKYVVANQPISMAVFMELESMKTHYKQAGAEITDEMTDEEVLAAITAFEEKPLEVLPTAEERIASALEFEVMMKLPQEPEVE